MLIAFEELKKSYLNWSFMLFAAVSMSLTSLDASSEEGLLQEVQMRFYVDPPAVHRGETVWILAEITIPSGSVLHMRASGPDYEASDLSVTLPSFLRLNRVIWPPPKVLRGDSEKQLQVGYAGRLYVLIETSFHYDEGQALRLAGKQAEAEVQAKLVLSSSDGKQIHMRKTQRVFLPRILLPRDVPPPVDVVNQSLFNYARSLLPQVLPSSRFHINWSSDRALLTIWGREKTSMSRLEGENSEQEFSPYMSKTPEASVRQVQEASRRWYLLLAESFDLSVIDRQLQEEGLLEVKSQRPSDATSWIAERKKLPTLFIQPLQLESSEHARYERFFMQPSAKQQLQQLNPAKLYLISEGGEEIYQINLEPPQSSFAKALSSVNIYTYVKRYWKMLGKRFHLF